MVMSIVLPDIASLTTFWTNASIRPRGTHVTRPTQTSRGGAHDDLADAASDGDQHNGYRPEQRRLRTCFSPNTLLGPRARWFPDLCLGAGCATWALRSAEAFSNEFSSRMGIPSRVRPTGGAKAYWVKGMPTPEMKRFPRGDYATFSRGSVLSNRSACSLRYPIGSVKNVSEAAREMMDERIRGRLGREQLQIIFAAASIHRMSRRSTHPSRRRFPCRPARRWIAACNCSGPTSY